MYSEAVGGVGPFVAPGRVAVDRADRADPETES
jgi:hypothetical protein